MYTYNAHCMNGCFETYKKVTVDEPLDEHPYCQCGWTDFGNGGILQAMNP